MGASTRGGTRVARLRSGGRVRGRAAILVITALVAACGNTPPSASPSATSPSAQASSAPTPASTSGPDAQPTTDPGAGSTAAPTRAPSAPPDAAWSAVILPDETAVANLEPTRSGAGGVATTTEFRLTSLDGTAPADLASRLRVDPAVKLAVASTRGSTAILRPAAALRPETLYRVSLLGADGTVQASWAAQTAGPLHLVESIPGDAATAVPLDAGIELIFDQAGVSTDDLRSHLRIQPAIAGRLQAAGRSVVFVPAKPFRRATLYTVTVTRGLPIAGTDQRLAADVRIRFETAARTTSRVSVGLRRSFVEATPRERAAMSIWWDSEEDVHPPARIPVTVHRLAGMQAAEVAWRAVNDAPTWTRADVRPPVPTSGLPKVVDARLALQGGDEGRWFLLPRPLPQGWYLVTLTWAGIPRQAVLQVTNLATYALVSTTRSTVWVNDLSSTRPVAGASIRLVGRPFGVTGANGLVVRPTPAAARTLRTDFGPRRVLLEIRSAGRTAFQPVATNSQYCDYCRQEGNDDLWRVITSDRYQYRSTDTVNAWGVVRNRDTGAVPPSVRVSLLTDTGDDASLPISTTTVTPDAIGAFAVAVPLQALPAGSYRLHVEAGRTDVGELWFGVGTITKPAYRLTIEPDRRAMTSGGIVSVAVHGSFFEGTPVAGTHIELAPDEGRGAGVATDAEGDATGRVRLDLTDENQWSVLSIMATPTLPEEADISASTTVAVFRGRSIVDVAGTVTGGRLRVNGKVSAVAFNRLNQATDDALWSIDPRGAPRPDARVQLRIEEHWSVRRHVGNQYDFVLKRVRPVYESDDRSRQVASTVVTTAADGTFRYALPTTPGRSYRIAASYVDRGTELNAEAWAYDASVDQDGDEPRLIGPAAGDDERTYRVGDPIRLRFTGGAVRPRAERYLFAVLQRGLRSVDVQASPTYRATFSAADIPGVEIQAVRFTGYGYEEAWSYGLPYRAEDKRLDIRITADRTRYAPGDTASLTIRTLDRSGRPVAASVFVQAVDEKLFATGDAAVVDPLDTLYAGVGSGLIATVRSHQTPFDDLYGEGGDTTGGGGDDGPRGDFRDWLLGRLIRTDARGTATLAAPLSDDLTSWHVSAEGVDRSLRAGAGELVLPVGLPFFAEATIPATFVAADEPVIRVRAFGGDLQAGDPVSFTVSSATLGMAPVTVTGTAFRAVEVPIGALTVGSHLIRVQASADGGALHDALDRTVVVLASRAAQEETRWEPLDGPTAVATGGGLTRLVLADAGRGRVVPLLQELASTGGSRCDQAIAQGIANRLLDTAFRIPVPQGDELALRPFVATDDEGLAIVPYGSMNLEVTALAAMSGDPRLDAETLRPPLWRIANDADAKRPRRLLALAGLAGLGDPVLQDVRAAAAQPDLTIEEQVDLALAALFAGDETLARSLEHRVVREHGQRLGPWTRLDAGGRDRSSVLTARLAIVAASIGEPVAAEMDAWLAEHPPARTLVVLERALAARGWAARVPGAAAKAAIVVDGTRRELDIQPDAAVTLTLTPAQAAGARVEPVSGKVLVVTTRSVPLEASSLTPAAGQALTRTVEPGMAIGETDTVVVTFRVTLGPDAGDQCWQLTDVVPSGLAPIFGGQRHDEEAPAGPAWVDGQRVAFCVQRNPNVKVQVLRYVARVVDPGRYAWEPAVLQSPIAPEQGVTTPAGTLVIAGAGS